MISTPEAEQPMSRTFNFGQSQALLDVDPKTFGRWLKKAKIDPSKQVNRADPREKLLTDEQILMLAKEHGRDVHFPPLDQENESEAEVTLATVDNRITALEHLIAQLFADLQGDLTNLAQRVTSTTQGSQAEVKQPPAPPAAPASSPARRPQKARKPTKKTTKGKRLPRGFIPLYVMRNEHGVSEKAVELAMDKGKITVERGKWLYNHRSITSALSQQGQHEFYSLFHERAGFQDCATCPHAL
jgi:hypothetical protein